MSLSRRPFLRDGYGRASTPHLWASGERQHSAGLLAILTLAVVLVSLLAHEPALDGGFTFDDKAHVLAKWASGPQPGVFDELASPTWPGNLYRPVSTLTLATDRWLSSRDRSGGLDPRPFRRTNVLLSALVAALGFLLLARILALGPAWIGALVFAVHPLHVEVVAGISNRSEMLAAALALGALLLVDGVGPAERRQDRGERRTRRRTMLTLSGAFVLALLCYLAKESGLVLLLLTPLVFTARYGLGEGLRRAGPPLVVFLAAAGVAAVLRHQVLGSLVSASAAIPFLDNPLAGEPPMARVAHALLLLGRYFGLGFAPLHVPIDSSYPAVRPLAEAFPADGVLYALLLFALSTTILVGLVRRSPAAVLGLWFLAAFAVTANLVIPIGTGFAVRLAYLPSLGIAGMIGLALYRLRSPVLRGMAGLAVVAVFLSETRLRVLDWRDDGTLFARAVEVEPNSARTHSAYGDVLAVHGTLAAAQERYARALELYPRYEGARYAHALIDFHRGEPRRAREDLARLAREHPTFAPALLALAGDAIQRDRLDEAADLFQRASAVEPGSQDPRRGLVEVASRRGDARGSR